MSVNIRNSQCLSVYSACNGTQPADIVFILDASGSVGSTNFRTQLDFVKKMIAGFYIGPQETQVGMFTFDGSVHPQFYLNKYHTKSPLKNRVLATTYVASPKQLLSCQPRVTVTSCFVYEVIRDL